MESNWRWNCAEWAQDLPGFSLIARTNPSVPLARWVAMYFGGGRRQFLGALTFTPFSLADWTIIQDYAPVGFPFTYPVDPD